MLLLARLQLEGVTLVLRPVPICGNFCLDGPTEHYPPLIISTDTIAGNVRNTATALFVVVQVEALDQAGDFLGAHLLTSKI